MRGSLQFVAQGHEDVNWIACLICKIDTKIAHNVQPLNVSETFLTSFSHLYMQATDSETLFLCVVFKVKLKASELDVLSQYTGQVLTVFL